MVEKKNNANEGVQVRVGDIVKVAGQIPSAYANQLKLGREYEVELNYGAGRGLLLTPVTSDGKKSSFGRVQTYENKLDKLINDGVLEIVSGEEAAEVTREEAGKAVEEIIDTTLKGLSSKESETTARVYSLIEEAGFSLMDSEVHRIKLLVLLNLSEDQGSIEQSELINKVMNGMENDVDKLSKVKAVIEAMIEGDDKIVNRDGQIFYGCGE